MGAMLQWERWRRRRLWLIASALFVVMLLFSIWWSGPGPPRRIVLATGSPEGGNAHFGKIYQERLGKLGLAVTLLPTHGSQENLELLIQGKAQVAFVQGGIYATERDPDGVVRGLAALHREPLWFFYRGPDVLNSLADFKGKRIAVGPRGSGIEIVGKTLLQVNGITETNAKVRYDLNMASAADELKLGKVDLALLITPGQNELVHDLFHQQGLRLLSIRQQDAYCRRFPYLTAVKLPEGVVDLEHNIPSREIALLAAPGILACRADLHPRAVEEILNVLQAVHAPANLVDPAQKYPSLQEVDIPIHDAAERYMRTGESMLSRLMPYWAIWLVYRVQLLILPFLAVWIPFLKILPAIYAFRVNRLLRHHYVALHEIETAIANANAPDKLRAQLQVLENLRSAMERVSRKIPGHMQRDVYHWRSHVAMVRDEALTRLKKLEGD